MTRLASFSVEGARFWGAVAGGGMIALSPDFPHWPTLRAMIAADGWDRAAHAAKGRAVTHPEGSFTWDIPLPDAEKIICVGVNYPARNAEYGDGQAAPANPSLFIRFARSFVGHEQALIRPLETHMLDYEGEIAIVVGRGGRRIARADAYRHIAALTLANEGTLRDWVRHGKFNVTQGKNWDASGAIGPYLTRFTDPTQIEDIALEARVNGELRQADRTSRMLFSFARIIEYISTFTTLVAGDMILTGTPTGAGARLEPPRYLAPGDLVEISAEGIGRLRNRVVDETR